MVIVSLLLAAQAAPPPTTIYVVRHAEKAKGDNPPLTEAGQERAASLADVLRDIDLDAVFTTNLCRTAQTVDATAHAAGLPLRTVRVADVKLAACVPQLTASRTPLEAFDDAERALVAELRDLPGGSHALVAGHSNTIPSLLEALGVASLCPETISLDEKGRCWLPHHAYDNLFVVSLPKRGPARLLPLHFGTPTPDP
jgi:broad specificity phosphatase PhoE